MPSHWGGWREAAPNGSALLNLSVVESACDCLTPDGARTTGGANGGAKRLTRLSHPGGGERIRIL
jgi:hypothetical protein